MRVFHSRSMIENGHLALALAPALTPAGIQNNPCFFQGIAAVPQVLARGLLVLADITSTRYFKYTPDVQRDPVLSAQGDCLRAECFSACNGVYARLDLLSSGFDGQIRYGTTNVDIGTSLRSALMNTGQKDKLHLNIGGEGLIFSKFTGSDGNILDFNGQVIERPVQMPDRWIRAMGNAAGIHRNMIPVLALNKVQAQSFVMSLPPATGKSQNIYVTLMGAGVKNSARPVPKSVLIPGPHRLSGLKRLMTNIESMTFYKGAEGNTGAFLLVAALPCARLTISLTPEPWQGYSGEGALLGALASQEVLEDAECIASGLSFESALDEAQLARLWHLDRKRVDTAIACLAVSGRLGFDVHDRTYFHRELPEDADRILKDNPRLTAARKMLDAVSRDSDGSYRVRSNNTDYRVHYNRKSGTEAAKCTCTWYMKHQNSRGPCKHILAVQLLVRGEQQA